MNRAAESKPPALPWIELLKEQVASLRYGVVQIVVHDWHVVQIEKTEKFRLEKSMAQEPAEM